MCRFIVIGSIVALIMSAPVVAQDPAKLAPEKYKATLDNDRARVLDIRLAPGEKSPMHSHPAYILYTITPGKARFTREDGSSKEVEFKAGDTRFVEAESHAVENIGNTELHVLNIELKQPGQEGAMPAAAREGEHELIVPDRMTWAPAPQGLPRGAQMATLEGDASKAQPFTVRFKVPAGYQVPPHWHPADERLTVIKGSMYMGMGDKLDKQKATKLVAGSYALMPARAHHFAYFDEETIFQLHATGPWDIIYLNPADDPRRKQ